MPYSKLIQEKPESKRIGSGTPSVKELMTIVGKACNQQQYHTNLRRESFSLPDCYFFTLRRKEDSKVVPVGVVARSDKRASEGLEFWIRKHIAQGIVPLIFFTKSGRFYNKGRIPNIKRDWKKNLLLLELLTYKDLGIEKDLVHFINYHEAKVEVMGVSYHKLGSQRSIGFHPWLKDNFYEISIPYRQGLFMPQLSAFKDEREYPHKFGFKESRSSLEENLDLFGNDDTK